MIRSGAYRNVLVVAAETLSRITNWQDRNTCVLFGDGAGAVVLRGTSRQRGLLASNLGAYGAGRDLIIVPAGGSARPATIETVSTGQHYLHMRGNEVFRFAVRMMNKAAQAVMEEAGLAAEDVALFVPHQANLRIIEALAERLHVPRERVWVNVDRFGNMSAATVPVALCEAAEAGCLQEGDRVVAVAFGAGLTWGAGVVAWGGV
jgi:3-oxoacyl-[acyl-carrier-protein] synthase-3